MSQLNKKKDKRNTTKKKETNGRQLFAQTKKTTNIQLPKFMKFRSK